MTRIVFLSLFLLGGCAYRIGGRNGRHIVGYTHMLQYTMPAENVEVLLQTVREIQEGLHDG